MGRNTVKTGSWRDGAEHGQDGLAAGRAAGRAYRLRLVLTAWPDGRRDGRAERAGVREGGRLGGRASERAADPSPNFWFLGALGRGRRAADRGVPGWVMGGSTNFAVLRAGREECLTRLRGRSYPQI